MTRIAINGFGRIGRAAAKIALENPDLEVVAVNDLGDVENLAYLMKFDSVYGRYDKKVAVRDGCLEIAGAKIKVFCQKDPASLPWQDEKIDVVIESTGFFTEYKDAKKHLDAGAKSVLISAPTKSDEQIPTILMGVNSDQLDVRKFPIIANASCTTNAAGPIAEIMCRRFKVEKAILTTVHAYTATQNLVDGPAAKDFRRGRAAAINSVLSTTGAAEATAKAVPALRGKFTGVAVRVPAAICSLADIVFSLKKSTTVEEVNKILEEESKSERYKGILGICREPLVSSDIKQTAESSIVDPEFTRVVDGNLVKIMAWYDNEWAYSVRMIEQAAAMGQQLRS